MPAHPGRALTPTTDYRKENRVKHTTTDGVDIDVYPVGLLSDVRRLRGALKHQPRPWDRRSPAGHPWHRLWYDMRCGTLDRIRRREWRALKNYFNGYLAEPTPFPDGLQRCGSGWTQRRALASLDRHLRATTNGGTR